MDQRGELNIWLHEMLAMIDKYIDYYYYTTCSGFKTLITLSYINEKLPYLSLPRKMRESEKMVLMYILREYRHRESLIPP